MKKAIVGNKAWMGSSKHEVTIVSAGHRFITVEDAYGRKHKFFADNLRNTYQYGASPSLCLDKEKLLQEERYSYLRRGVMDAIAPKGHENHPVQFTLGELELLHQLITNRRILRHFKGKDYIYIGEGIHTETSEMHVYYAEPDGSKSYNRPKSMVFEEVTNEEGESVPRFVLMERENS